MLRRACFLLFLILSRIASSQVVSSPRIWNDKDLSEWASPVATLNIRPTHFSERDYYSAREAESVRTYPVCFPGSEPEGYWQMLQAKKPEPLIARGARTKTEWIKAGQTIFREGDVPPFRSYDPAIIATVRSPEAFRNAGGRALADGTVIGLRWVPTSKGVALSILDWGGCHTRLMPDGSYVDGAPGNTPGSRVIGQLVAAYSSSTGDEGPTIKAWRQFAVPWIPHDIHSNIKSMQPPELRALLGSGVIGTFARFNGSP